jgi:hypothetical protein
LVGEELVDAALALPTAFLPEGGGYTMAAVLAFEQNRNLLVAPDGRWLGRYVPAALRTYPFAIGRTEDGNEVLCIDESSGLLASDGQGERLFEEDGTLAPAVAEIMQLLANIEANRKLTAAACAALQSANLIEPWPIALKTNEAEKRIEGLFRISEAALNALPEAQFAALRNHGALMVAYAQLFSMRNLPSLAHLAQAAAAKPAQTAAVPPQPMLAGKDLDLSWLKGDTIKF